MTHTEGQVDLVELHGRERQVRLGRVTVREEQRHTQELEAHRAALELKVLIQADGAKVGTTDHRTKALSRLSIALRPGRRANTVLRVNGCTTNGRRSTVLGKVAAVGGPVGLTLVEMHERRPRVRRPRAVVCHPLETRVRLTDNASAIRTRRLEQGQAVVIEDVRVDNLTNSTTRHWGTGRNVRQVHDIRQTGEQHKQERLTAEIRSALKLPSKVAAAKIADSGGGATGKLLHSVGLGTLRVTVRGTLVDRGRRVPVRK